MQTVRFCNYNVDYMQRLGFLKVLCKIGDGVRGGKREMLQRLRLLYPESRRPQLPGFDRGLFDPHKLLQKDVVPSWQPGFVAKSLDRLITWGEMVGLVAPNERLSEWARILLSLQRETAKADWDSDNPFVLSAEERAFFVHLLLYHDQVMVHLIALLSAYDPDAMITTKDSCRLATQALGAFFDTIPINSVDEIRVRAELRNILERIGQQYKLKDPRSLAISETRTKILEEWKDKPQKIRTHLAEYHAICRFEQLTDLGFLVKEDPSNPAVDDVSRGKMRRDWRWFIVPGLLRAAPAIIPHITNIESFLTNEWILFCSRAFDLPLVWLDAQNDEMEIADLLDITLPRVRRAFGPVQVHSWAVLACLEALGRGKRLEIADILRFLNTLQTRPQEGRAVRLGGRDTFLGPTASVPKDGVSSLLKE